MICKKCAKGKHQKCVSIGQWCDCQHRIPKPVVHVAIINVTDSNNPKPWREFIANADSVPHLFAFNAPATPDYQAVNKFHVIITYRKGPSL